MTCAQCGIDLPAGALSCPECHALAHAGRLDALSAQARAASAAGDLAAARWAWEQALPLLPPDTTQYKTVQSKIAELASKLEAPPPKPEHPMRKRLGALGVVGTALWKFKTIVLVVLTKGKLLLLGLTKLSTLGSMLLSMGLYWTLYGWKFALGFVLSIYVHEMGHVAALARYGIPATAPMFIPGFGAVVRLKAYPASPGEDARVGLAGPIWGLGAAIVCMGMYLVTRSGLWAALAQTGAWINLFNLIPVWQLDGGRGFRALTRKQRGIVLGVALVLWYMTSEIMLLLIALGATYRLFSKDWPEQPDNVALGQFAGLMAALSVVYLITVGASH
jgi:Zn-dependent protease